MSIKSYCIEQGTTIEKLIKITGVSRSTLYSMEAGTKRDIKLSTVQNLYNATKKVFSRPLTISDYSDFKFN